MVKEKIEMNIHEKVEQQYELVKRYNSLNDEKESLTPYLEELLKQFKNEERDPIHIVNDMKEVIDRLYVREYEKATLVKLIENF